PWSGTVRCTNIHDTGTERTPGTSFRNLTRVSNAREVYYEPAPRMCQPSRIEGISPVSTPRRRRPTMADVAERAGVSRTLVSFILDGKPGASDETRRRVLAIAGEIGYRPDSAARLLAQGRSRTLGVM